MVNLKLEWRMASDLMDSSCGLLSSLAYSLIALNLVRVILYFQVDPPSTQLQVEGGSTRTVILN